MTTGIHPADLHRRVIDMDSGFACTVTSAAPTSGPLAWVDQPVEVGVVGTTAVMLSLSGGTRTSDPSSLLRSVMAEILDSAKSASTSGPTAILHARKRLSELHEAGALCEALPNGVVLNISPTGEILACRVGPVAIAVFHHGLVRLLHADDRLPALAKLGAALEGALPPSLLEDPLLSAVTSLTEVTPDGEDIGGGLLPRGGAAILLSRGAFPFYPPHGPIPVDSWHRLGAGWQYGMGATVASVYWKDAPPPTVGEWL